jgi:hypothetical protein
MALFTPEQKPADGSMSTVGALDFIQQKYEKQRKRWREKSTVAISQNLGSKKSINIRFVSKWQSKLSGKVHLFIS